MTKAASKKSSSIFLFFGEDNYSSYQKVKFWRDQFTSKHGDTNLEIHDSKSLNPGQFKNDIETMPFLSEKRLIIIKNLFQEAKPDLLEKISKAIDNAADFSIIVFHEDNTIDKRLGLFKKLKKIGQVSEFKAPSPIEIRQWIIDKAQKENIKLNYAAASYLSQHCKPNLWNIAQEVEKLKLYANGQEITPQMIESMVPPSLSSSIFKLTDSLTAKNRKQALATLEILKESGEELGKIFYMIARHFRILVQVNDMLQRGSSTKEISKKLKVHNFVIQKTSQQSKNFNKSTLKNIYQELLQIDIGTKTGIIKTFQKDDRQFKLALEQFILKCCQ